MRGRCRLMGNKGAKVLLCVCLAESKVLPPVLPWCCRISSHANPTQATTYYVVYFLHVRLLNVVLYLFVCVQAACVTHLVRGRARERGQWSTASLRATMPLFVNPTLPSPSEPHSRTGTLQLLEVIVNICRGQLQRTHPFFVDLGGYPSILIPGTSTSHFVFFSPGPCCIRIHT